MQDELQTIDKIRKHNKFKIILSTQTLKTINLKVKINNVNQFNNIARLTMLYNVPPEDFSPRVNVAACFIEHSNEVLFLQRSSHAPQPGPWGVPGGKLEHNETPEQAVTREILEECGFRLTAPIYLHSVYIRHGECDYIYHMFKQLVKNKPKIDLDLKENVAYQWLTRQQVVDLDTTKQLISEEMNCIQLIYKNFESGSSYCPD